MTDGFDMEFRLLISRITDQTLRIGTDSQAPAAHQDIGAKHPTDPITVTRLIRTRRATKAVPMVL